MDEQILMKYFDFDEADLAANRNGLLTDKQQKYLSEDLRYGRLFGLGCSGLLFIGAIAVPLILYASPLINAIQTQDFSGLRDFWSTAMIVTPLGIFMALILLVNMVSRSQPKILLKKAQGSANIVAVERRFDLKHPVYLVNVLHIGELAIDIKDSLAGQIIQGDVYAAYFVENKNETGKQILSLELISKK